MTPTDQVRALEAENQRLRNQLTTEQDTRRRYQGALNRAEDLIARETNAAHRQAKEADTKERYEAMLLIESAYMKSRAIITRARKEAEK